MEPLANTNGLTPFDLELSRLYEETKRLSLLGFESATSIDQLKGTPHLKTTLQKIINGFAIERTILVGKLLQADAQRVLHAKRNTRKRNTNSFDPNEAIADKQCKVIAALLAAISELENAHKRLYVSCIGAPPPEFVPPNTTQTSLIDNVQAARQRLIMKSQTRRGK